MYGSREKSNMSVLLFYFLLYFNFIYLFLFRTDGQKKTNCLVIKNEQNKDKKQEHQHDEFNFPCPYVSGCKRLHVANPAQVMSPSMCTESNPGKDENKTGK